MGTDGNNAHPFMMVSIMLAATVYTLDSTIAAIALPQMQGTFSVTQDQIAWVLTSYIVVSAIFTPIAGYLATRFGQRSMFLSCVAGFVFASVMCGLAVNLEEMVLFRILQGMFGAALIPLSQASILQAYPAEDYGRGMALFGIGVMLGPIIGPSLGGWLTDIANWRWVFLINLPVGLVALLGLHLTVPREELPEKPKPFDFLGFAFLGISIGALQLMLDRGNSLGWFSSLEIRIEAFISSLFLYLFFVQAIKGRKPFIDPRLLKDWNFSVSTIVGFTIGFTMMATMAILPPLMQTILNYPVLTTGIILAPRGVGTMISMFVVGRLVGVLDPRKLIAFGLLLSSTALWEMSQFDHNVTPAMLAWTGVIQGLGMGFTFVPLSTIAFSTLDPAYRNDGTALYSLGRNFGSSVGISILMGALAVYARENRSHLIDNINPFNPALTQGLPAMLDYRVDAGLEILNQMVQREAIMLAYLDDFRLMIAITLITIPLVFMLKLPERQTALAA